MACVAAGVFFFAWSGIRGALQFSAIVLGLLTALSWALGEAFIKLGLSRAGTLADTLVALVAATALTIVIFLPKLPVMARLLMNERRSPRWLFPFMLHGVLSIGLAYPSFFESIRRIGLGHTALTTAFSDSGDLLRLYRGQRNRQDFKLPALVLPAAMFLLTGNLIQLLALL